MAIVNQMIFAVATSAGNKSMGLLPVDLNTNLAYIDQSTVVFGYFHQLYADYTSGEEKLLAHLINGNNIYGYRNPNGGFEYRFKDQNGVLLFSKGTNNSRYDYDMFVVRENGATNYRILLLKRATENPESAIFYQVEMELGGSLPAIAAFFENAIPPEHVWTPFDMLVGNGGRYRCLLTMINAEKIGDPTTAIVTTEISDFDRISEQSNLLPIFQNLPLGEERTIAWSGNNWLTLTASRNTDPDTSDYILLFKFWLDGTPTPIYTYTGRIQVDTYLQYPYLSFIIDEDNEIAMFDPVTYYDDSASLHEPHWGYIARTQTDLDMELLYLWLQGSVEGTPSDNPYDIGSDDNGGEGGNYQPQGHLPSNPLPSLDAMNLGLFTVYVPDDSTLEDIADFLWSDNVLDNFKKYFNNFNENIIALYVLPYTPQNLPTKAFKVGRLESQTITSVPYLLTRYVNIDMGEVTVTPTYTAYLDYSPYTKFEIYLPGIGVQALDADEIMSPATMGGYLPEKQGSTISLEYRLDLFTGIFVAYVKINGEVRYQFPGKVGITLPLTGENYSSMISAFIGGVSMLAGTIASGGLTAPMASGMVSAAVAGTVNAMKPEVYRSGNLSGDSSMLAYNTPYLIKHIPNRAYLDDQNKFTGIPSYKTGNLSEFGGYTEVIEAHVEGISCTEDERKMILDALKGGVII